ncbi:diguanylate cyclase [Stutzerimonas zhaodongensis]|uniref:Diguanylate cyclase n=1 Tax=Stutzerimonas zhaodongensis TaxID=1176257 RepID=A0A3M2HCW1_9GAMM|nr:diguanylate cyclase [Stutzerimonas zhaodongensis]MCQ4317766.1 GGDEF domain-containing protein [Stutzerimonas zhaodongensis]RMH87586.1 diguanylate cyclase [Stutzerimonas zhaodongensis]
MQNYRIRTLYEALDAELPTDAGVESRSTELPCAVGYPGADGWQAGGTVSCGINHFKALNDRCGHTCGDHVHVQAARQLKTVLRTDYVLIRLGVKSL